MNLRKVKIKIKTMQDIYPLTRYHHPRLRNIISYLFLCYLIRTTIFNPNLKLQFPPPPPPQRLLLLRLKGQEVVLLYLPIALVILPTLPIPMILLGREGRGVEP